MKSRRKRASEELNKLADQLCGSVGVVDGIHTLSIHESSGTGNVKCVNFDAGLTAMEFEMLLYSDISISLSTNEKAIYFIYCLEGSCFYRPGSHDNMVKLNELQSAILRTTISGNERLLFKDEENISLNLIRVDTEQYLNAKEDTSSIANKLAIFFSEFEQRHALVHLGKLNLEISELLKKLRQAKYADSLSELLHFEGVCILILASHIGQYRSESDGKVNSTSLIKRELKVIMRLADNIQQVPEKQYSLEILCKESGLSAVKLQEGFKFLYQRTVSDFIRNTRLERAERLLKDTDMNISEVVYSIGLTSRSYFCKVFKAKYSCSPKNYKSKVNLTHKEFKTILK